MRDTFIFFLLVLFVFAAATQDPLIFTLVYLVGGASFLARLWSQRSLKAVRLKRKFQKRAFPDEVIRVRVEGENTSWIPAVWLQLTDLLVVDITQSGSFQQVFSLGGHEKRQFEYLLTPRKRGYYPVGPLRLATGDVLGLNRDLDRTEQQEYLTVYPRVYPLAGLDLPSRSPLGTLRYKQPIFEDPTRPVGKRDYTGGDSLRRIDWKASAVVGRLQVKKFEPSIALETMLFLDLNADAYTSRFRYDATETAICVAASVASWVTHHKQAVGLASNGVDMLAETEKMRMIPARKGRGHLMRLLELLARIKMAPAEPLASLIHRELPQLGWGTTLVVIAGDAGEELFEAFFHAHRAGMSVVLFLCGENQNAQQIKRRCRQFSIPFHSLRGEKDLQRWRYAA